MGSFKTHAGPVALIAMVCGAMFYAAVVGYVPIAVIGAENGVVGIANGETKSDAILEERIAKLEARWKDWTETMNVDFESVRKGWTRSNTLTANLIERQGQQQEKLEELRWEVADLLIAHQRNSKDAVGNESHPENTVIVQKGYPNERIPFGVVIDDQRPAEKRLKMHYLSVDLGNGLEKRVYPEVVEWRGEPEAK